MAQPWLLLSLGATHFSITVGAFDAGGVLGAVGLLVIHPDHDRRPLSSWMAVA